MSDTFVKTITSQTMNLDLTKTLGGARDLSGLCTDLFLIVIRMREAEELGEPAALQKLIGYYIGLFEKNCRAMNIDEESIQEVKYALVALIDETVLSVPGECRDYWFSHPMQLDLFGDNLAGEEFYNKLQKLLLVPEKKKDVLEVFYLCLSLGFEGRYKMFNPEERLAMMDDLGRKLRRTRVRVSSGLSPHGKRADAPAANQRPKGLPFPLWLPAAVGAGAIALTWGALMLVNSSQLTSTLNAINPLIAK